ncbi:MAG: hypothetical protein GWP08_14255 [Nitrospiraceae bacterium]|nr:hypothetical protein [Nitrospiraceae bacterium]
MKKVILMVSLSLFPRLLVAQELDIQSLAGEDWYGLYMNGSKAGYAVESLNVAEDGTVIVAEEAHFKIKMMGIEQHMRVALQRRYAPDGPLLSISQEVEDSVTTKRFEGRVEGDNFILSSSVGGVESQETLPKPKESLADALQHARLVGEHGKVGDELTFSVFEPIYKTEIEGRSRIIAIEERILDGVPTRVFKVNSVMQPLGVESVCYITEDGTTLEDTMSGILTMRLEPKEIAQDVGYINDVIVSNAAIADRPVENPRKRPSLRLRIKGPVTEDHLFNDERQQLTPQDGSVLFQSRLNAVDGFQAAQLPVTDPAVVKWIEPSLLVQSDDKRLIDKAKEIVGGEKDTLAISNALCSWVHDNIRTTFSAQLTNAIEVLENLEGDCTEYSILFIGLARAAGLPVREAAGLIYVQESRPAFYFHQWASVWVGKWIDVDPTFDQPVADVTHIKLAEGDMFEQAKLIPTIGQISIEVLEDE